MAGHSSTRFSGSFKAPLALAAMVGLSACATMDSEPGRVTIMTGSYHVAEAPKGPDHNGFNPINPGVLLTWEGEPVDLTAGAFWNSYNRPSIAGFASIPLIEAGDFALDAFAGVALYPEDGRRFAVHAGDFVPLAGIQARLNGFTVNVMPSDCAYTCAIVSAGYTFDF